MPTDSYEVLRPAEMPIFCALVIQRLREHGGEDELQELLEDTFVELYGQISEAQEARIQQAL